MKIIVSVLFLCQLLLLSLYGLFLFGHYTTQSVLYKNNTVLLVNFYNQEEYQFFLDLMDEKNIPVAKFNFINDNFISVYTNDISLWGNIHMYQGIKPQNGTTEFISNINTGESTQSGIFHNVAPGFDIMVSHIDNPNNFYTDGFYFMHTTDTEMVQDILYELENNILYANLFLMGGDYNILNILGPFYRTNLVTITIITLICILMFLCIFTSIIQYSIFQLKYSSILLVNGYSKQKVILITTLKMLKPLLRVLVVCFITFFIFAIYQGYNFYILKLSLYYLVFSIFLVFLYVFIANIFINFYLKRITTIEILKGKKPYYFVQVCSLFIQFIFIVIFMWGINYNLDNYKVLNNRLEYLSHWVVARNIYSVRAANVGQMGNFYIEQELTDKLVELYEYLIANNNAFIMNSRNYDNMSFFDRTPETMGTFPYGPNGYSVTISPNYLEFNPIVAVNNIPIKDQIIYDDYIMNILVPKSLIDYREEIALSYLNYFHFHKETVYNIYNEEFGIELTTIPIEDLSINIIYVEDNQQYFAFDPYLHSNESSMIKDPVAMIYTGNVHQSYLYSNFTHSVFMYADTLDIYGLMQPTLIELDLVSGIYGFGAVYEENARVISGIRQELAVNLLVIITMFIGNIMITYNLIANYFYRNRYTIFIKSLFGYSALKRNYIFTIGLTLYILLITLVAWIFIGTTSLILGDILLIKNILLIIIIEKLLLSKSYVDLMKGER